MTPLHQALLSQLAATHRGEPWYGTSLTTFLDGVTAEQAIIKPSSDTRSVWEQVLHMTAWTAEVTQRLTGGAPGTPAMGDWPRISDTSPRAWSAAVSAFDAAHSELIRGATALSPEQLAKRLGTGATVGETLIGIAQHDAFHIGQLAQTRRLVTSR